jgi:hypothetical protein
MNIPTSFKMRSRLSAFRLREGHLKFVLLLGFTVAVVTELCRSTDRYDSFSRLCLLFWPAMLLHQCEENVFTELALGRRFAFLTWVRNVGFNITATRAIALNVGVGWSLAIMAGCVGALFPAMPLFLIAVEAVNGFWHLSVTSLQRRWSPGTLSSVLVTIPLAFAAFHIALTSQLVEPWECGMILVAAVFSHHQFLASLPRIEGGSKVTHGGG